MIIQDRREIVWKVRNQRDDATAKNADEKAAHSIPSVRQTQCNICTFAVTHTIKKCPHFHHSINVHPS
jgi:hypothetical protein